MNEELIDRLTIKIFLRSWIIIKWLLFQYLLLLFVPFVWGFLSSGFFLYVLVYTVSFNIYWEVVSKEKRLDFLWKPYVGYFVSSSILSLLLGEFSFWGILSSSLFGLICFLALKLYSRLYKRCANSSVKRAALILCPIMIVVLAKVWSVSIGCQHHGSLESEKEEVMQRRNYLNSKLITMPQRILSEMPSGIGEQFQGEWALYSCSMFAMALHNMSVIYPETKDENLVGIDSLIKIVLSPELRKYDTRRWGSDALETLDLDDESHISYISHLAWMIGEYKAIGGKDTYDDLYHRLCEAMNRRILKSPSMNLETYPNEVIYIPDMLVAIVALKQYSEINKGKYASTVDAWIKKAKLEWCDSETGLLASFLDKNGNQFSDLPVKGSYSGLNCSYLTLLDTKFAREQYVLLKEYFWNNGIISGMKEYHNASPLLAFDIDAGFIVCGLSPSGTAFSLGAVTFFKDNEVRNGILQTAEVAGHSLSWNNQTHYLLADFALVGEAIMLAMRTNLDELVYFE